MRKLAIMPLLAILALGCANFAQVSALTIVTAEEAGKLAATIGADAYKVENDKITAGLDALTAEIVAKRSALACGDGKAESLPAGCDFEAWVAYQAEAKVRLDALEGKGARNDDRFEVLEKALETHAHALDLVGRALLAYVQAKERGSAPTIVDLLGQVVAAYGTIAKSLALWGVEAPSVPGL